MGSDAIVLPLVLEIDVGDPPPHGPLDHHEDGEGHRVGHRQARVDRHTEHDRIEDEAEQQLELIFNFVHEIEDVVEGRAGEKGFDLLAGLLVGKQPRIAAVVAGELQHETAERVEAGPLGEIPTQRAGDIGRRLGNEYPDEVASLEVLVGHRTARPDDEPGGQGGEQCLGHHQRDHDVERPTQKIADKLPSGDWPPRGRWRGPSFGQIGNGHGFGPLLCSEAATDGSNIAAGPLFARCILSSARRCTAAA